MEVCSTTYPRVRDPRVNAPQPTQTSFVRERCRRQKSIGSSGHGLDRYVAVYERKADIEFLTAKRP